MDLSGVTSNLVMIYAVPNATVPAVMRGMFAAGFAPSSHEPCYTWLAPEDVSSWQKDRSVLDDLAARGRLRGLTSDDVPNILKTWYVIQCEATKPRQSRVNMCFPGSTQTTRRLMPCPRTLLVTPALASLVTTGTW